MNDDELNNYIYYTSLINKKDAKILVGMRDIQARVDSNSWALHRLLYHPISAYVCGYLCSIIKSATNWLMSTIFSFRSFLLCLFCSFSCEIKNSFVFFRIQSERWDCRGYSIDNYCLFDHFRRNFIGGWKFIRGNCF